VCPPTSSPAPWTRFVRPSWWITILGIGLYFVLDVVAQLLPPHYSPISQAESDLGVGPYGWVMNVNFVVRGILSLAFVYALYSAWPRPDRPRVGLALIAAWGMGAFILSVSTADVSGPSTLHGTIHNVTALLAFLFVAIGAVLVSYAMPGEPPWETVRPPARVLAVLTLIAMLVLFIGTGLPRVEHALFGLLERIFIGFTLLWMLVVSIALLRLDPGRRAVGASVS
jgi:hypothetical membrane protein